MKNYCINKSGHYDIRPEEQELIAAAITLNEWLAKNAKATSRQLDALSKMYKFLKNLPNPPEQNFNGEFGFEILANVEKDHDGHIGSWSVSVCRGQFEIFSVGHEPFEEFTWDLCPGVKNRNSLAGVQEWIEQVTNPYRLVFADKKMVIEASIWETAE